MRNQTFSFAGMRDNFSQLITHGPAFNFSVYDIARIREEFKALVVSLAMLYAQYKQKGEAKAAFYGRKKAKTVAEGKENHAVQNDNEDEVYAHASEAGIIEVFSGSESKHKRSAAPKNPIPIRQGDGVREHLITSLDLDELQTGSHVLIKHACPRYKQDHWFAFVVKRGSGNRQGQFKIRWEGMKNVKSNHVWVKEDAIRRIYPIPLMQDDEAREHLITRTDLDELQTGSHVLVKHVCPRHKQDHWFAFVVKRGSGDRQGQFKIRWEGMKNVKSNHAWVKEDAIKRIYVH